MIFSLNRPHWCFYLHWSRDSVSLVCEIFYIYSACLSNICLCWPYCLHVPMTPALTHNAQETPKPQPPVFQFGDRSATATARALLTPVVQRDLRRAAPAVLGARGPGGELPGHALGRGCTQVPLRHSCTKLGT